MADSPATESASCRRGRGNSWYDSPDVVKEDNVAGVVILSWIDFEPGDRDVYLEHGKELIAASHQEPGCVRHVMAPDPQSPTAVIAHAHYRDDTAFKEHVQSDAFVRFLFRTESCRVRERNTDRFEATKVN